MSFLYRFAITVTRKQPYLDWASNLDDNEGLSSTLTDDPRTIYLAPESTAEPDVEALMDEFWEQIFEEELAAWERDESHWPAPRTRELFDAWFGAEVTPSVFDLTPEEPLRHEEVEALDLDYVLHHCAACEIQLEEGAGRLVEFALADRSQLEFREGLVVSFAIDDERSVTGIMSMPDSEEARNGADLLFRACTSRCERVLRSVVP